jgi:hypothetical protein
MNISRRTALRFFTFLATLPPSALAAALLTGCGASQTTIAAIITTIGAGVSTALTLAGLGPVGTIISTAAQTAANAVIGWKPGTPGQDVVQALNIFISVLKDNLIPALNPTVEAVIQNAVSTVESLLGDFGVTTAAIASAAKTHLILLHSLPNKYPSVAALKAAKADFIAAHNRIVSADPKFTAAKL